MKLKKELVDELIKATKDFYTTNDNDILPALEKFENELKQNCKATWDVVSLIGDLARFTRHNREGTYEDIYKALAIFGVIVE